MTASFLNSNEKKQNDKVFKVFILNRYDFEDKPIEEYHNFLEQREQLAYNFIHNQNLEESEKTLRMFSRINQDIITSRQAQRLEEQKTGNLKVFPLLAQKTFRKSKKSLASDIAKITYSDSQFIKDVNSRRTTWKPGEDIPIDVVGGASSDWFYQKCIQELKDSMWRPVPKS